MNDHSTDVLNELRNQLAHLPHLLAVFERSMTRFMAELPGSVAVTGSLATGKLDPYSDLDLLIFLSRAADLVAEQRRVARIIGACGPVLTAYSYDHIGKPNLFVYLLEIEWTPVQVDVTVVLAGDVDVPEHVVVVHDPDALFGSPGRDASAPHHAAGEANLPALLQKFCGWVWYVYAKLARGERFQAAYALDYARQMAVLPLLSAAEGVALRGYRRLEEELPRPVIQMLERSHPGSLERKQVFQALAALVELVMELESRLEGRLPSDRERGDLQRTWELTRRYAANTLGVS